MNQPTTKLGRALAGVPVQEPGGSKLAHALAGVRLRKPITIPLVQMPASMTLLGALELLNIEADSILAMESKLGIARSVATQGNYELDRAVRTLAHAVLDVQTDQPIGTIDDWGRFPPQTIASLWRAYSDLSEEHDPDNTLPTISAADLAEVRAAIASANHTTLIGIGSRNLAATLVAVVAELDAKTAELASTKATGDGA